MAGVLDGVSQKFTLLHLEGKLVFHEHVTNPFEQMEQQSHGARIVAHRRMPSMLIWLPR